MITFVRAYAANPTNHSHTLLAQCALFCIKITFNSKLFDAVRLAMKMPIETSDL